MPRIESGGTHFSRDSMRVNKDILESRVLDFVLNLINKGRLRASGNNGVIISVDTFSIQFRGLIKELDMDESVISETVAKIIKLSEVGRLDKEVAMHIKALEILKSKREAGRNYAGIPRVLGDRLFSVPISDESSASYFSSLDVKREVGGSLDLYMMDQIDGVDMATLMYRHVLEHRIKTKGSLMNLHCSDDIDSLSFSDLHHIVSMELGFQEYVGVVDIGEIMQNTKNAKLLFKALRRSGFQLNADFLVSIKNTMDLLNANGLYHCDLHPRNIMMGRDGSAWIVDFGSAHMSVGSEDPYLDELSGERRPNDRSFFLGYEEFVEVKTGVEDDKYKEVREYVHRLISEPKNARQEKTAKSISSLKVSIDSIEEGVDSGRIKDIVRNIVALVGVGNPDVAALLIYELLEKARESNVVFDKDVLEGIPSSIFYKFGKPL